MKIVVLGGTGFTGKRVLPMLSKNNHTVRCVVRQKEKFPQIEKMNMEPFLAEASDKDSLKRAFQGFESLISIMSLGFGHADHIVSCAENAEMKRAVFVSTTAVETKLNANSKKIRLAAEETIKNSALDWTILRPTMIYGGQDDRNIIKLFRTVKKWPVIFIPGNGESLQQPVFVEDVAKAIIDSFQSDQTVKKTYNISGKEPLSFNQLIDVVEQVLDTKRSKIHLPIKPIAFMFRILEKIMKKPFLKEEQILRLLEDKAFSHEAASKDFGYSPISFFEGAKMELQNFGAL